MRRLKQVLTYGWAHSAQAIREGATSSRIKIFLDILYCFKKYKMWSNQYIEKQFYALSKNERNSIGLKYYEAGQERDEWQKDFVENRKFLHKWMNTKYEIGNNREKRQKAYTKKYNAGKNLIVEYDVHLSRQHYLPGTISIGNNVLLAKHVFIDYSGNVVIKDNVSIANGVIILSHDHNRFTDNTITKRGGGSAYQTELIIEEGAVISTRAIILPTCNYIGKNSRIGAGVVVKNDVPDNTLIATKPAKMVSFK